MKFYRYRLSDGMIVAECMRRSTTPALPVPHDGYGYIAVDDWSRTHYVDVTASPHALATRTRIAAGWDKQTIAAGGVDVATFAPVPAGTLFEVAGALVQVDDGALEVTANLVGSYRIKVVSPQYFPESWDVEAT